LCGGGGGGGGGRKAYLRGVTDMVDMEVTHHHHIMFGTRSNVGKLIGEMHHGCGLKKVVHGSFVPSKKNPRIC